MPKRTIFSLLLVIFAVAVISGSSLAAGEINASYFDHSGSLVVSPPTSSISEALAADDNQFVQLAPGAWVVMKFPDDHAAMPDGTSIPDLQIAVFDSLYPAEAEILSFGERSPLSRGRQVELASACIIRFSGIKLCRTTCPGFSARPARPAT